MTNQETVDFEEFYAPLNTWFGVRAYPSEQGLAVYFRDITETRRAAEEIRFKNTILQTQQEASLDAILLVGTNGQIISYNQRFVDLWHLSPKLVSAGLDAPVLRSVAGQVEDAEAFVARVQYLNQHPSDKSHEEVSLKDGRIIDRYSAAVVGTDHKHYGRVWYFRDITERKMAEQKFKDLLESAPDAMVIVNHDAEMVLVNAHALKLFGWRREELLGQKIDMLVPERFRATHPDNRNAFFFPQPQVRATGAGLELFGLRKDGSEFPVEVSLSPLETSEGTLAITAIRDISERKRLELEKEQYFKFFTLSSSPMCIADPYGCLQQVNPAFVRLTGYSASELVSKPFLSFVLPQDRQRTTDEMKLQVETRPSMHFENRYMRKDGTVMHLSWMAYFDSRDRVSYAVADDITERKEADARITHLNRVYAVLSGINTLIVRVRNRNELFREACRIAAEAGGFRMAMIGIVDRSTMKVAPVASAGKDDGLLTAIKDILASTENSSKTMVAQAIREKKAVVSNDSQSDPRILFGVKYAEAGVRSLIVLPLMVAGEAVGVLSLYSSETEFFQKEELKLLTELAGDIAFAIDHIDKQERLDYLAYYDVLTGLANRMLFLERVAQYMRSAVGNRHQLAVFLIDLERFKNLNDSLGRPAGDELLRQVAQWLTRSAGDANLLARVGADQFALVLPQVRQDGDVTRLLEKTMAAFLEHPFRLNDAVFRISVRVGVALFPEDGADAEMLFRNAEAALKKAKASGERYLVYTQRMTEAAAGRLTLENQLRQALDNGEFVLYYQPKVNLVSGKITGAEALIRWNDPHTGLVPPGRFIPILEETGLIYDVGRWALKKAIADYLRWRAAGLAAVRIAVNVSPLQLRNRGFIAEIEQAIGIDANAAAGLELEITESLIMEDIKLSISSLQAIRALGVTVAIDDFGTGFSSLSYLAKLPVDTLKIDRSFVIEMTAGPEGLALVATIITLAHSLKLKVVAEGVETEEQSRLLRLLACDEMQGFLFGKAVPAESFETRYLAPPRI